MKKFMILLITTLLLTACGVSEEVKIEEEHGRFSRSDSSLHITNDNETGCKYLIYVVGTAGGITPLLKPDGTPDCD